MLKLRSLDLIFTTEYQLSDCDLVQCVLSVYTV